MKRDPQWARHIGAQERSGKSQAQYCREEGLDLKSFGYHKKRLKGQSSSVGFIQIHGKEEYFEIETCGARVRIPVSYGLMRVLEDLNVRGK